LISWIAYTFIAPSSYLQVPLRIDPLHGTINAEARTNMETIGKSLTVTSIEPIAPLKRHSRAQMALAFGVAAVSDVLAMATVIAPPLQIALDAATALVLFLVLGRRWALLPGLIVEAIPGMGVFPVWVLVVLSIIMYDGIKKPHKA
jgi:hypothetical protein